MTQAITNIVALDVGQARIGVAVANTIARIASSLPAIEHGDTIYDDIARLVAEQQAATVVVGWPRNLSGDETSQTQYVADFIGKLAAAVPVPIVRQDEALTSVNAESELKARGEQFAKGDVDSLSAVYILEDYLREGVH